MSPPISTHLRPTRRLGKWPHFARIFTGLFCLAQCSLSMGQNVLGDWNTLIFNGPLTKGEPWIYYAEFSERNSQNAEKTSFGLAQLTTYDGLGYKWSPHHQVLVGFAYQYTQPPYANRIVQELDGWQQYEYMDQFMEGGYSTRTRLEERNDIVQASADGPSLRFRQRLKYVHPINLDWDAIVSEEVFFNLNQVNWGPAQGFAQNRFFIGLGYKFSPALRTEFGYMNQYVNRNLDECFIGNLLSLNFIVNPSEWSDASRDLGERKP